MRCFYFARLAARRHPATLRFAPTVAQLTRRLSSASLATAAKTRVALDQTEKGKIRVVDLGEIDYESALKLQEQVMERHIATHRGGDLSEDWLLLCVHNPGVYTIGRRQWRTLEKEIRCDLSEELEVLKVQRGGNITHHCKGQLVAYPLMDLSAAHLKRDLYWYLRTLESVTMKVVSEMRDNFQNSNLADELSTTPLPMTASTEVAAANGIGGVQTKAKPLFDVFRDPDLTGVWVEDRHGNVDKISAIGIAVSRWKTYHGLSLNVSCDLRGFDKIRPCGIDKERTNKGVTTLQKLLADGSHDVHNEAALMSKTKALMLKHFADVFNVQCVDSHKNQLLDFLGFKDSCL